MKFQVKQEVVDENKTDLDQLVVFRLLVHDATRVNPAKLAVERKTRMPGNLMSGSHKTEFKEPENYPSQGRPPRTPGQVLLQRGFASSGRTGLRRGRCYEKRTDCLLYTSRCV